jgi:hypothetical protein
VALHASPVVDQSNEDEHYHHHDLDHCEPILGLSFKNRLYNMSLLHYNRKRTVDANMNKLHRKNWNDDNKGPMPSLQTRRPILQTHRAGLFTFTAYLSYALAI